MRQSRPQVQDGDDRERTPTGVLVLWALCRGTLAFHVQGFRVTSPGRAVLSPSPPWLEKEIVEYPPPPTRLAEIEFNVFAAIHFLVEKLRTHDYSFVGNQQGRRCFNYNHFSYIHEWGWGCLTYRNYVCRMTCACALLFDACSYVTRVAYVPPMSPLWLCPRDVATMIMSSRRRRYEYVLLTSPLWLCPPDVARARSIPWQENFLDPSGATSSR